MRKVFKDSDDEVFDLGDEEGGGWSDDETMSVCSKAMDEKPKASDRDHTHTHTHTQ